MHCEIMILVRKMFYFTLCIVFAHASITGLFLWDHIKTPIMSIKSDVMECLIQGLVALMNETPVSKKYFVSTTHCCQNQLNKSDWLV